MRLGMLGQSQDQGEDCRAVMVTVIIDCLRDAMTLPAET